MARPAAALLALACLLLSLARMAHAAELVMFREDGCPYCAEWEREVGRIYPLTPEAAQAPLRRIDVGTQRPPGLELDGTIRYTPTFVLVEGGTEIGRITGYPGEESFWSLLGEMLDKLGQKKTPREDDPS